MYFNCCTILLWSKACRNGSISVRFKRKSSLDWNKYVQIEEPQQKATNMMTVADIFSWCYHLKREKKGKSRKKQQHLLPVKSFNKRPVLTKKAKWLHYSLMKDQPRNESKINSAAHDSLFLFPFVFLFFSSIHSLLLIFHSLIRFVHVSIHCIELMPDKKNDIIVKSVRIVNWSTQIWFLPSWPRFVIA